MSLKVGDKAPDFTLPSFNNSDEPVDYSLITYNGKKNVVLLFFPQAFTGVCTDEMCLVRDNMNLEAGDGTEVHKKV